MLTVILLGLLFFFFSVAFRCDSELRNAWQMNPVVDCFSSSFLANNKEKEKSNDEKQVKSKSINSSDVDGW